MCVSVFLEIVKCKKKKVVNLFCIVPRFLCNIRVSIRIVECFEISSQNDSSMFAHKVLSVWDWAAYFVRFWKKQRFWIWVAPKWWTLLSTISQEAVQIMLFSNIWILQKSSKWALRYMFFSRALFCCVVSRVTLFFHIYISESWKFKSRSCSSCAQRLHQL